MKKVLLTGGSGFIGRNILESYLAEKYEILAPSHREMDATDDAAVDAWFKGNSVDCILHAATKPGHRNAKDPTNIFYSNTRMYFNLARHAPEVERMIVLGSGAIYDMRYYYPKMREEAYGEHVPADDLGFSKYVCEKHLESSDNIVDLRIFGIYGKYEDYSIRFVSNMVCKALFDLPLTIKQNRKFDYVCVDDLFPVIDSFLSAGPKYKSYNVTPDDSVELVLIAEKVLDAAGKKLPIRVTAQGMGLEYSGSNSRLASEFAWYRTTPIGEGIRTLLAWYASRLGDIDRNSLLVDK